VHDAELLVRHHVAEVGQELIAGQRIEARHRLVQDQQLGPLGDGQGQGQLRTLAAGQLPGAPPRRQAEPLHPRPGQGVIYGALRAGAVGFILKDAGPVLLAEAVRAAAAGDALISPSVTLRLLQHLAAGPAARAGRAGRPGRASAAPRPATPLSERETEVIAAIATGRTNQEIGAGLFISLSTVKSHLASVQQKLGLRNRVEIAAWAWETGLIDPAVSPRPW
jgi:DNA-binding CsgD family transcriptional regulator